MLYLQKDAAGTRNASPFANSAAAAQAEEGSLSKEASHHEIAASFDELVARRAHVRVPSQVRAFVSAHMGAAARQRLWTHRRLRKPLWVSSFIFSMPCSAGVHHGVGVLSVRPARRTKPLPQAHQSTEARTKRGQKVSSAPAPAARPQTCQTSSSSTPGPSQTHTYPHFRVPYP